VEIAVAALELPHPRLPDRKFVLIPLAEIAGNAVVYKGQSSQQLLAATTDDSQVNRYGSINSVGQAKAID